MPRLNRISAKIQEIHVSGFRSLRDVTLALGDVNVIIGANGSGKSNLIQFFDMLGWMLKAGKLAEFVERHGGADDQLFGGNKVTPRCSAHIVFHTKTGTSEYRFSLAHASPDRFFFSDEAYRYSRSAQGTFAPWIELQRGHREAAILHAADQESDASPGARKTARIIVDFLRNCSVFQFHDTSAQAYIKQPWDRDDNGFLRGHGGNLAPILLYLRENHRKLYDLIGLQIEQILPAFSGFELEATYGKVSLRWRNKYTPDKTIGAHLTSDGSLRLFALVTLLNLPPDMLPDIVLLDEPELGLHPAGVALIGHMIRKLSRARQIIVATQSPLLVDAFALDSIIVAESVEGETKFIPKKAEDYQVWLDDDFSPGTLWLKNLLGGRP